MSEDRSRRVAPHVEQRYQALAVDGELRCPLCTRAVKLPASGDITLRVFDEFGGHLMSHQQIEFVEYIAELERANEPTLVEWSAVDEVAAAVDRAATS